MVEITQKYLALKCLSLKYYIFFFLSFPHTFCCQIQKEKNISCSIFFLSNFNKLVIKISILFFLVRLHKEIENAFFRVSRDKNIHLRNLHTGVTPRTSSQADDDLHVLASRDAREICVPFSFFLSRPLTWLQRKVPFCFLLHAWCQLHDKEGTFLSMFAHLCTTSFS